MPNIKVAFDVSNKGTVVSDVQCSNIRENCSHPEVLNKGTAGRLVQRENIPKHSVRLGVLKGGTVVSLEQLSNISLIYSTVEVSNSATEVRLLHLLANALRFVTPVILAPSISNISVCRSRRYDQLLFSYVRSHTLGLDET